MDCIGGGSDGRCGLIPVFSIFSGVGGLDLGAEIAGLRVATALDSDKEAIATHRKVFDAQIFCTRTEDVDARDIVRLSDVPADGSAVLIGGPPCTAFSHAGFWIEAKRSGQDEQSHRIDDYLSFVRALRPRAFVMENVPGLLFRNHILVLKKFESKCRSLGYSVVHKVLNAADYGVPQRRRRLFVVGLRSKHEFEFPVGTFLDVPRTSGWAIARLPKDTNPKERDEVLRGKYSDLLRSVPPGDNYLFYTARRGATKPLFDWRKKYWSFLLKLNPAEPAPTIPATRITNNGPFHWRNRHLRIAELKRLQGFPDNFPVHSGPAGRREVGNAVPPLLAAQVFCQLRRVLDNRNRGNTDRLRAALEAGASADLVSHALETKSN